MTQKLATKEFVRSLLDRLSYVLQVPRDHLTVKWVNRPRGFVTVLLPEHRFVNGVIAGQLLLPGHQLMSLADTEGFMNLSAHDDSTCPGDQHPQLAVVFRRVR